MTSLDEPATHSWNVTGENGRLVEGWGSPPSTIHSTLVPAERKSLGAAAGAGTTTLVPCSRERFARNTVAERGWVTQRSTLAYAGPLCEGWGGNPVPGELDPCSVDPYATHNFQNEYKTSYWGMPPDQDTTPNGVWANCTNYVAFVESTV
jgi:hypothetical protein